MILTYNILPNKKDDPDYPNKKIFRETTHLSHRNNHYRTFTIL